MNVSFYLYISTNGGCQSQKKGRSFFSKRIDSFLERTGSFAKKRNVEIAVNLTKKSLICEQLLQNPPVLTLLPVVFSP